MQFDNKKFADNVAETMVLLQKLQESLQFQDAGRGFTSLEKAANSVQLTGIQNSIDAVEKKFSSFGIAGARVIWDLTGLVENKLGGALKTLWGNTIGQAKSGGFKRALNIAQADFQMRGLLKDAENMEEQVKLIKDNINEAVSGTAYSYDAAAKVGAQLLASQVKPGQDMLKALRAVSGLAAMTNTSYEEIGNIMTDIAGAGKLTNEMLTRFSYRGMNATAALGKQLGKTEEQVREMVKKGQIDFQTFANAMDDAFGEHATAANETYSGSLDNMKAALSRIGAVYYESHLNVMKDVFNALRVAINKVKVAITPFIEKINALERVIADAFIKRVEKFTEWLGNTKWVKSLEEANKATEEAAKTLGKYDEIVKQVIRGDFGNGKKRVEKLTSANWDYATVQALVNKQLYGYDKAVKDLTDDEIKKIAYDEAQLEALTALRDAEKKAADEGKKAATETPIVKTLTNFKIAIENFKIGFKEIGKGIKQAFREVFNFNKIGDGIVDVVYTISDLFRELSEYFGDGHETAKRWYEIFKLIFTVVRDFVGLIVGVAKKILPPFLSFVFSALYVIFNFVSNIAQRINGFIQIVKRVGPLIKQEIIDPIVDFASRRLKPIIDFVKELWDKLVGFSLDGFDSSFKTVPEEVIQPIEEKIMAFGQWLRDIPNKVQRVVDKLPIDEIKNFFGRIYDSPIVQKFVDKIKELAGHFKDLRDHLDEVPLSFEIFIDLAKDGKKYVDKFREALDKAKEKLGELKDKFIELGYLDQLKNYIEIIKGRLDRLWVTMRPFFKEKIPDMFGKLVGQVKTLYGQIKNSRPIEFLVNSVKSIFEGLTSGRYLNDILDDLLAAKDLIMSFFAGNNKTGAGIGAGMLQLKTDDKSFAAVGKKIEDLARPIKEALENIFGDPDEVYKKANEGLHNLLQGIADALTLKNFDASTAYKLLAAATVVIGVIRLFKAVSNLVRSKDAIGAVFIGLANIFESASDYIDAKTLSVTAKSMLQVAKSLLIIVLSLLAVGYMDTEQLGRAVGAIAVIFLVLSLFMWTLGKLENAMANREKNKQQAEDMKKVAETVKNTQTDLTNLGQLFATGITGAAKILTQGLGDAAKQIAKGISKSFVIVAVVIALRGLAKVLKEFSQIEWKSADVIEALVAMGTMVVLLTVIATIMSKGKDHASIGDALVFVAIAKSLQMLGKAVMLMALATKMDNFGLAVAVLYGFLAFIIVLAFVMKEMEHISESSIKGDYIGSGFKAKGGGNSIISLGFAVIMICYAMKLMANAVAQMANIPEDGFKQAVDTLGTFGLFLIVLLAFSRNYTTGSGGGISGGTGPLLAMGVMAVLVAIAINALVPAITAVTALARFAPAELNHAAIILGIMMIIMGLLGIMARAAGPNSMIKAGLAMVIMAYGIKVLADALGILAAVQKMDGTVKTLGVLVVTLVIMGVVMAGLTAAAVLFPDALRFAVLALLSFGAAITLIGAGLWLFAASLENAGKFLPAFAEGIVGFAQIILDKFPIIIGAILVIIAGVAAAIRFASVPISLAIVTLVASVAVALLMAVSSVSNETMMKLGGMLGAGVVKLLIFLFSVLWGALKTLVLWVYDNLPKWLEANTPGLLKGFFNIIMYVAQALMWLINNTIGRFLGLFTDFDADEFQKELDKTFEDVHAYLDDKKKEVESDLNSDDSNVKNPFGLDPDKINQNADEVSGAYESGTAKIVTAAESGREQIHGKTFMPLDDDNSMFPPKEEIIQQGDEAADGVDKALSTVDAAWGKIDEIFTGGAKTDLGEQGSADGKSYAENLVGSMYNFVNGGDNPVKGDISNLLLGEDAVEQMKGQGIDLTENGLLAGWGEGFNGASSDLFTKFVDGDMTGAEDVSETHSPSARTERLGQNIIQGFENGLNSGDASSEGFTSIVDTILSKVESLATGLGEKATGALVGFKTAISDGMSAATSSIEGFNTSATNAVSGLPEALGEKATGAANKFKSGLTDGKRGISNAAISIANAVTSNVSLYNRMYNLGINAVQGFVNGIRSRIQSAANAAAAMADESSKSAKSHLDVNSPSKVFRALGYSVGEGFIQGIERMTPAVSKVSGQMADDSIDGFKNALVAVDSLLSSNLDYNPTITPVLDLEDLQTGLGTLNTMMARNSALSMLTGSDTRNSKWALQRSLNNSLNAMVASSGNTDVVDAINSLKEDNAELRAAISSMKVVMNNRFVGQIDTSLGRQQKMVNRG
jgi:tape measure domain-containing protein